MNEASSRSHALFSIAIESEVVKNGKLFFCRGKINIVDLAGSERVYKSRNSEDMMKEARSINLSLHYLEQVIITLKDARDQREARVSRRRRHSFSNSQQLKAGDLKSTSELSIPTAKEKDIVPVEKSKIHIPYRNSVLTSILRDSLGGNCRTSFLLTVSFEKNNFGESMSTCR